MKICVWKTGHVIAGTVAGAISSQCYHTDNLCDEVINDFDCHIGYGILRGMDKVFRKCDELGKPWFNIDRGYWKPGHFDGYYRVSLNGTQQTTFNGLEPDYDRWDALGLSIEPMRPNQPDQVLICPPTDYVKGFFSDIDDDKWLDKAIKDIRSLGYMNEKIRTKQMSMESADPDMLASSLLYTFNCSLGWKGLRLGVPCISDPDHSILGAYQKTVDNNLNNDLDSRRKFFAIQASLQLTLPEMKAGKLWPLLQKLLTCSSVGTHAKP